MVFVYEDRVYYISRIFLLSGEDNIGYIGYIKDWKFLIRFGCLD